ncbi:hypothetical protein JCM10212_003615 [Sporobolomyces blumeae]
MSGEDFEEKAAEMNAPHRKFVPSARSIGYAVAFFIIFGLAAGQVGTTSKMLQKYGNAVVRYPDAETKHVIGLLLFTGIASLLLALGSPFSPLYFLSFMTFALSVISITGAGILNHEIPFNASCSNTGSVTGNWAGFGSDCKVMVGLEGISWALWAVQFLVAIGLFVDAFTHGKKGHKRHYVYGA